MQILSLAQLTSRPAASVVTVGNFDGVHRGHQTLISEVVQHAREQGATAMVVTFEPHTRAALSPGTPVPLLTTLKEKGVIIEKLGVDALVWLPFDAAVSRMMPEAFVREILVARLGAVEWVMGEGHAWGRNRTGDTELLHSLMSGKHFIVSISKLVSRQSAPISSTDIRARILHGEMEEAAQVLGHPYAIVARRIRGAGKAGELGFPTLNFEKPRPPKVLPPSGVYAGTLQFERHEHPGALYFGNCPTFERRAMHFEFHSLAPLETEPAEGEEVCLWVHRFMREDKAFADEQQLREQVRQDVRDIGRFLSRE